MRGLTGKVAVVAGGAGGIGTATCLRLAQEGVAVVVSDINGPAAKEVAERIRSEGAQAVSCQTDIGDEEQVRGLIDLAVSEYGGIDILHANAADLSPNNLGRDSNAVEIPLDVFDRTIQVNALGYLLCSRHAVPEMTKRGGGALVFTSSGAAFAGEPQRLAYAMSKSAVNALVRHIASRWGKEGIRANAIAPGLILTDTTRTTLSDEFRARSLTVVRSKRLGIPEDIASTVAFLASDDGEWINGQVITVDGGSSFR